MMLAEPDEGVAVASSSTLLVLGTSKKRTTILSKMYQITFFKVDPAFLMSVVYTCLKFLLWYCFTSVGNNKLVNLLQNVFSI